MRKYLGLVFAFLGEGEPPEFPLYPEFAHFDGMLEIDFYERECNYFQNIDNALDHCHLGFVHGAAADSMGDVVGRAIKIKESDWGVTLTSNRQSDGQAFISQFGMPNMPMYPPSAAIVSTSIPRMMPSSSNAMRAVVTWSRPVRNLRSSRRLSGFPTYMTIPEFLIGGVASGGSRPILKIVGAAGISDRSPCRFHHPGAPNIFFQRLPEGSTCRKEEADRPCPVTLRVEARWRLALFVLLQSLQQQAAYPDDRRIAAAEMFDGAVGNWPHRFLYGAILDTKTSHPGK